MIKRYFLYFFISLFPLIGKFSLLSAQATERRSMKMEKKSPISYTANKIKIETKNNIVYLEGNAVVKKDGSQLQADFITVDNNKKYLIAADNVFFFNKKKDIYYRGDHIKYHMQKKIVYGKDRPKIEKKKSNVIFFQTL